MPHACLPVRPSHGHECLAFGSSVAPIGSGYSLLQLCWPGEAFVLGPDGAPEPLVASAF